MMEHDEAEATDYAVINIVFQCIFTELDILYAS